MRWANLIREPEADGVPQLPLGIPSAVVRRFDTPAFAGMTFYEIHAKSVVNRVPGSARVPFEWTINPYRGCSHSCVYCFARNTHTYLDLDPGADFDRQVVVKVNAPQVLRRELAAPSWGGDHIAMGTNVDCYQRAEGRYQLMPGILAALRDFGNPFSILTKGTLILRDLDLLRQAASVTEVGLAVSVGFVDEVLWRSVEPGTPSPRRRLDVVRRLRDAGFRVSVLMAPILPGLSDDDPQIEQTVAAIAAAGATSLTPLPLHLRPGAREWYGRWLAREHPELAGRYRELYGGGAYAPAAYQRALTARVRAAARRHGLAGPRQPAGDQLADGSAAVPGRGPSDGPGSGAGATSASAHRRARRPPASTPGSEQPTLW